ncbi:MAG: hypothetical protein HFE66_00460 [Clostridiales bacterium]|nr:hypothetical protein [Clostridiales bacterium]
MPDSEVNGDFSQVLRQLMDNPEISNLIASLKSDTENTQKIDAPSEILEQANEQAEAGTEETATSVQVPSLSPEMLAKLPTVMSMLSGMGIGAPTADQKDGDSVQNKEENAPQKDGSGGDAHRKALLRALRPYLNPKRRTVVDSMLQLGDLTKLFGTGLKK